METALLMLLLFAALVGIVFIVIRSTHSGSHADHAPNPPPEHTSPTRTSRGDIPPTVHEILTQQAHPMERTGVQHSNFTMTVNRQTGEPRTPSTYTDPPPRLSPAQEAELEIYRTAWEKRTDTGE